MCFFLLKKPSLPPPSYNISPPPPPSLSNIHTLLLATPLPDCFYPSYHTDSDSASPEVSHLSRLLALAVVSSLSTWDLAVSCARLHLFSGAPGGTEQDGSEGGLVKKVLEHFSTDYELHSSSWKDLIVRQCFTACSLLHRYLHTNLHSQQGPRALALITTLEKQGVGGWVWLRCNGNQAMYEW